MLWVQGAEGLDCKPWDATQLDTKGGQLVDPPGIFGQLTPLPEVLYTNNSKALKVYKSPHQKYA